MADAARPLVTNQSIDDFPDRSRRVVAVQPIKIDAVQVQQFQAGRQIRLQVGGRDAQGEITLPIIELAALGRDHERLARSPFQQFAEHALTGRVRDAGNPVAVGMSGIDEVAAAREKGVENLCRLVRRLRGAEHVGAQAQRADRQVGFGNGKLDWHGALLFTYRVVGR